MQRHHRAERDRVIGADHGLRLHQWSVEQPHRAGVAALHAALAELVPILLGAQSVGAQMRVEHREQFRRFEGKLVAGHIRRGGDALFCQMPDDHFHRGVLVDADQ